MSGVTGRQLADFMASISEGDLLVIEKRGWWRGDGGDPDMYQRVVKVRAGGIDTRANRHNNQGFTFSRPKRLSDVLELTDDSLTYRSAGPKGYVWGFRVERAS